MKQYRLLIVWNGRNISGREYRDLGEVSEAHALARLEEMFAHEDVAQVVLQERPVGEWEEIARNARDVAIAEPLAGSAPDTSEGSAG